MQQNARACGDNSGVQWPHAVAYRWMHVTLGIKIFCHSSARAHGLRQKAHVLQTLELENLLINAAITMHGAEQRTESRGAHAREDFTKRDDEHWMKHTVGWFEYPQEDVSKVSLLQLTGVAVRFWRWHACQHRCCGLCSHVLHVLAAEMVQHGLVVSNSHEGGRSIVQSCACRAKCE